MEQFFNLQQQNLIDFEFSHIRDVLFFNSALACVPPKSVIAAYQDYINSLTLDYSRGRDIASRQGLARKNLAQLVGCKTEEIAFVKNTAEGVGILANGFPYKKGQNVVIIDQEHASNSFVYQRLCEQGLELRIVKSQPDNIELQDILGKIDENTAIVALSSVQSNGGFYCDLEKIGAYCHEKGAIFAVDGIQSVGRLHMDVKKMNIDYLSCGGHKGLLAIKGIGFVYCSEKLLPTLIPPYASHTSTKTQVDFTSDNHKLDWHGDARRLEAGTMNILGISALGAGAELLLKLGTENIEKHIAALEALLEDKMKGFSLKSTMHKANGKVSGIFIVYVAPEKIKAVAKLLEEENVIATVRDNYFRISLNFFNTEKQVESLAEVLKKCEQGAQ